MAGLKRRLEAEVEIRVAGGDAFHEILVNRPHHLANVNPHVVQGCDLHHGTFGKPDSHICWKYKLDGKEQTCKQIIEVMDEENKVIKFNCVEGDILNHYKNFFIIYQVIPKGKETSIVKWILEYEKTHHGIPEPGTLMDALIGITKDTDDHHHRHGSHAK